MIDRFRFWIWRTKMAFRFSGSGPFETVWRIRVEAVYKPLFRRSGFDAVLKEHARYVKDLSDKYR
jgi:hypothetical protein